MIILFYQQLNKITLSVTCQSAVLSHVALLDLEFWCKRLQIRSVQTNDLLITCHFTHCCPSPAHHSCSASMWLCGATVTWIKYLAALGERSQDFGGLWPRITQQLSTDPQVPALAWGEQDCKGWNPPWVWQAWELSLLVLSKLWWHRMTSPAHSYREIGWIKGWLLIKVQSFKLWASFHVVLQSSNTR